MLSDMLNAVSIVKTCVQCMCSVCVRVCERERERDCCSSYTGSVIRCIRRLEELIRQMCQAAKAIGNVELENKFSQGNSTAIYYRSSYELLFIQSITYFCLS